MSDHLVVPRTLIALPLSRERQWPGAARATASSAHLLAYLAAITEKPRLITAVAVVPYRGAVHTAKIATTIDVLSNGRMVLGAGAGWLKEEFQAPNAPPFEERGRVTDEWLQAFKLLWTEDEAALRGPPRPLRRGHLPAQARAEAAPADLGRRREPARVRRTVRYGDAWFPIGNNPHHPLDTVARFKAGVAKLHQVAEQNGRDPTDDRARVLRRLVR